MKIWRIIDSVAIVLYTFVILLIIEFGHPTQDWINVSLSLGLLLTACRVVRR